MISFLNTKTLLTSPRAPHYPDVLFHDQKPTLRGEGWSKYQVPTPAVQLAQVDNSSKT